MSVLHDSYHTSLDGAEWPSCLEVVVYVLHCPCFGFFFPFLREELMAFCGVKGMKLQNECVKVRYSG